MTTYEVYLETANQIKLLQVCFNKENALAAAKVHKELVVYECTPKSVKRINQSKIK